MDQGVIILNAGSLILRWVGLYLATPRATVYGQYEFSFEENTLVTFIHEKSRFSNGTQGLLKVKQVPEVCLMERETSVRSFLSGFVIGVELTTVLSPLNLHLTLALELVLKFVAGRVFR